MPDCENCNERCQQAEMAHEIALGRMYATNELVKLLKKIENGQLVEVIRCKDCKHHEDEEIGMVYCPNMLGGWVEENWFCADGARKDGDCDG